MSYVCLLEIHLHFPTNGSLKGKRKELSSLKAQLRRRFGASVAETDHHDLWQRATLTAALVGRDAGPVRETAASVKRYVLGNFPEGARVEIQMVSREDLY
ncbi:MAG TPA: DUF503 domain-containing protein [Thermoleophilaceae bacterium]|nr:DUF503 domain-containing protein [Thermoleophilaceae bacterium]